MATVITDGRALRHIGVVAVIGLLIAFSGCAALEEDVLGGPSGPGEDQTPDEATANESDETTATDSNETAATDSNETTATDSNETAADGSDETTAGSNETTEDHSHGSAANESDESTADESNESATRSGKITVVVAGSELKLDERVGGDQISIAPDDEHTWRAPSDLTLAAALESFGVDSRADSLTVDGTTHREATDGTEIHYRVNGQAVDPASHVLQDDDQVWVTVETAEATYDVPGTYIKAAQQHAHGQMTFLVEGEEIDFSAARFQSGHRHFHFENGHADPWHAHSWSVTLQYALNTLSGIDVTESTVTYNETTYRADEPGTTVSITVNGDEVDPATYFLKDGDDVRIVAESDGS